MLYLVENKGELKNIKSRETQGTEGFYSENTLYEIIIMDIFVQTLRMTLQMNPNVGSAMVKENHSSE